MSYFGVEKCHLSHFWVKKRDFKWFFGSKEVILGDLILGLKQFNFWSFSATARNFAFL